MFHVVSFTSDVVKDKMVVPSSWLSKKDDLCLLPPSVTMATVAEMENLAQLCVQPGVGWRMYDVVSLKVFDTFAAAKDALGRSKTSSPTESEVGHKREKRRPARLNEYTTSDDDEESEVDRMLTDAFVTPPSTNPDPLIVKVEPLSTSSKRGKELKLSEFVPFYAGDISGQSTSRTSDDYSQLQMSGAADVGDPVKCPCNSTCHRLILKSLRRIRQQVKTNTLLLQQLIDRQKDPVLDLTSHGLPKDFPVTLPATDMKDIETLETYLQNDSHFAQTVPYFTELGGIDAKQTLKRVMVKMLSIDLAEQLNWKGRGAKKPFCEYTKIHRLVFHAVKQNPRSGVTTLADTERFIKDWLRFAPDKRGNRKKNAEVEEKVLRW